MSVSRCSLKIHQILQPITYYTFFFHFATSITLPKINENGEKRVLGVRTPLGGALVFAERWEVRSRTDGATALYRAYDAALFLLSEVHQFLSFACASVSIGWPNLSEANDLRTAENRLADTARGVGAAGRTGRLLDALCFIPTLVFRGSLLFVYATEDRSSYSVLICDIRSVPGDEPVHRARPAERPFPTPNGGHDESSALPDLPPVEPPSAGFVVQLFVIPAAVVVVVIIVWLLFGKLAGGERDAMEYVRQLRSPTANWRLAFELASLIQHDAKIGSDPVLLGELTDLLSHELDQGDADPKLTQYLALTLGAFQTLEARTESGQIVDPLVRLARALGAKYKPRDPDRGGRQPGQAGGPA